MRIWSLFHYFKWVLTVKSAELILWADRFLLEGTFSLSVSQCMARHSDHGQRTYVNGCNKMFSRSLSQSLSALFWSINRLSSKRWTYKTHNNPLWRKGLTGIHVQQYLQKNISKLVGILKHWFQRNLFTQQFFLFYLQFIYYNNYNKKIMYSMIIKCAILYRKQQSMLRPMSKVRWNMYSL